MPAITSANLDTIVSDCESGKMDGTPPPPPPPPAPGLPKLGGTGPAQTPKGPTPNTPMKRLQWVKIPEMKVKNTINLWTVASRMCSTVQLNFNKVEELFSHRAQSSSSNNNNNNNNWNPNSSCNSAQNDSTNHSAFYNRDVDRLGFDSTDCSKERIDSFSNCWEKKRKCEEVNLLDPKRSMNVNIFLRQLRLSNEELLVKIKRCDTESFDVETLKTLARLVPEDSDKAVLANYKGDPEKLGSAEKFYLALMSLPNFDLIIQTMLLKEEFFQALDVIKPAIDSVIMCSKGIKESKAFHEVIYLVLMVGNFLNAGAYSGDAAGFRLCSLLQLREIKANDNKVHLLHYVAQEAESKDATLIDQLEELKYLSNASLHNVCALYSDIKMLKDGMTTNIAKLMESEHPHGETMKRLRPIEMNVNNEMAMLETEAKEVENLRMDLASYFCEDESSFKLDECMNIVNSFCKRFLLAHEENKERRLQAEKAEQKRLERQKTLQRRVNVVGAGFSPVPFNSSNDKNGSPFDPSNALNRPGQTLPTHARARSASCARGTGWEDAASMSDINSTDESHLLDVLLRPPFYADNASDARKFNSLRVNRRRSKNTPELWERERVSSPFGGESRNFGSQSSSPVCHGTADGQGSSCAVDYERQTPSNSSGLGLVRNSFARSSCPSRVQHSARQSSDNPILSQNAARMNSNDEENNFENVEFRKSSRASNKTDLERRMSREVAMGAASFEQQIRELESSLNRFDKDLDFDKTLNNRKHISAPPLESHRVPKIRLSSPEKLEAKVSRVIENAQTGDISSAGEGHRNQRSSSNMRERMKKLTQLYSGGEPQEVQLNKPSTYGREVHAPELMRGFSRDPRSLYSNYSNQNCDKHLVDNEGNLIFKDEGFDSEGFSNTSASQKSSRSSSRERDSGQIDWNFRLGSDERSVAQQLTGFMKEAGRPDDNTSTASSNRLFDRSIESLVSKDLTVVDCNSVNETLNKDVRKADEGRKSQNNGAKQGVIKSNQSSIRTSSTMSSKQGVQKKIDRNVKASNSPSLGKKISTMLSRTASKPASRITQLAENKKPVVKADNKRNAETANNSSRLITPTNKTRSLSRPTAIISKISRDSSATLAAKRIDPNPSKASPRSLSMAGQRMSRNLSSLGLGQKRPSVGSTCSSISSDASTKYTHVSRDTKPRNTKGGGSLNSTFPFKVSTKSSLFSPARQSPIGNHKRTPSTCSTSSNVQPKNSNFIRQSLTRSTLPTKLYVTSKTSLGYARTIETRPENPTTSKMSRPIKPAMSTFNSLSTTKPESKHKSLK